ncbi:MAG: hypothetical protein NTV43_07620 [Methylococcales bacterium]|nr:hypothetical protein [Methylococcales bacterium]
MLDHTDSEQTKSALLLPWIIQGLMLATLASLLIVCLSLGGEIQEPLPESQRELIRTVLYIIAIITFPMTNLLRHIQLRLNQTMPFSDKTVEQVATKRYLTTVVVSLSMIESVGIFGFVMFVLGDNVNTLYIMVGLSALGMFLYRPKAQEYHQIVESLATKAHE